MVLDVPSDGVPDNRARWLQRDSRICLQNLGEEALLEGSMLHRPYECATARSAINLSSTPTTAPNPAWRASSRLKQAWHCRSHATAAVEWYISVPYTTTRRRAQLTYKQTLTPSCRYTEEDAFPSNPFGRRPAVSATNASNPSGSYIQARTHEKAICKK